MDKKTHDTVVVLDFGAINSQAAAKRIRNMNIYCEVLPYTASAERILALKPKSIVFQRGKQCGEGLHAPRQGPPLIWQGGVHPPHARTFARAMHLRQLRRLVQHGACHRNERRLRFCDTAEKSREVRTHRLR